MYSPKVHEDLVRLLYKLKQIKKRPMTFLINEAVQKYLEEQSFMIKKDKEARNERMDGLV